VGLTAAEYARICQLLEREPNDLELEMFGVLWSEHCSYKHTRSLLSRFPTVGAHVLQGPGENAGAVDIGGGLAAVMKIESHNHPSAVEPFQGAATGVGGIVRDILAMGARPIALMDALCFGAPHDRATAYLAGGVVGGIAFYGNCVGVPTVGGSITFDPRYTLNPLVNVLCLGIAPRDRISRARASGDGNPVLLVGASTGRDGIAGASFASTELSEASADRRPAVQVGDPFLEKLLIEACLEVLQTDDVVAVQDLGAGGLTAAATELAARGEAGIEIDVARVSRRESSMTPYEVMLSESQERMLFVVRQGSEDRVRRGFERWGLRADRVGHVTSDGLLRVRDAERGVAEAPARVLSVGPPDYQGASTARRGAPALPEEAAPLAPDDLSAVLLRLLESPNLCSRRAVFEQYDHMVQTNTVVPPGEGAAVLRVKGTRKGLVLGLGSCPRVCSLDPWIGGAMAVAEACRNVACAGGRPIALTDGLNFGDPERPEVWQALVGVIEGMREACLALDVPIISGNVSLYNETDGLGILPTPIVAALGLLDDVSQHARAGVSGGDALWLLGPLGAYLSGSEYAAYIHGWFGQRAPSLDLDLERRVQGCVRELIGAGIVGRAGDITDGGLAVALAELALTSHVGVQCNGSWVERLEAGELGRADATLFGEAPSRIIISAPDEQEAEIEAVAARWHVPLTRLGTAGGSDIRVGSLVVMALEDAQRRWATALDRLLQG
jgi:phosphoribosylformylglycinamidine synthase